MRKKAAINVFAGVLAFASPGIYAQQIPPMTAGQAGPDAPAGQASAPPAANANPNFAPSATASVNIPAPTQQQQAPISTPQALDSGPTSQQVEQAKANAFEQVTQNALPMSPDQIKKLRSLFSESQRAASAYPGTPPKPVATSELVNLAPGETPPVVRLGQGYVTSIVFVDSTGAPWPIQGYDIGNPAAFNIQWDKSSNILMIQSTAMFGLGNLAVQLKNLNTPVMVTLVPGQPIVDYRIDMRVQGLGPNAVAKPTGDQLPAAASSELLNVLDGIPPKNAKTLTIPGSQSQAWLLGDKLYLRTKLSLISPAWIAEMTSADGMHAYELPQTPTLLVNNNIGQISTLRVEGF